MFYSLDVLFQFSRGRAFDGIEIYFGSEGIDTFMPVFISKQAGVFTANPVEFRVTPLTVQEAFDQGVEPSLRRLDRYSPDRAGECILNYLNNVDNLLDSMQMQMTSTTLYCM